MNRLVAIAIAVLVVAAVGLAGLRYWRDRHPATPPPAAADSTQAGLHAATLWFPDETGDSLVAEVRELPEADGAHARVAQLVAALAQGPQRRGVALMPQGTTVLHAYLDDQGLLTLDLSRAFAQGFRGGSRAEELQAGSLLRTIGENLPEVRRVLLVCGGAPIASLGGHLPLDQPIDPHEAY